MTDLIQVLVGGVLIGGLYVAISIGFSLSFGVLDVVDLAVGMWVVLGAFAAVMSRQWFGLDLFLALPLIFVVLVQIQDGQVRAIAPAGSAQTEMVYPLVPWSDR